MPGTLHSNGEIQAGDIGFARTLDTTGRFIRFGEFLRLRKKLRSDGKTYGEYINHTFQVVSTGDVGTGVLIVQATVKGMVISPLQQLIDDGADVFIFPPPAECDRQKLINFSMATVGAPYGVMSIVCISIDILTWSWMPSFRRAGTWICSAATAESLRYAGWLHTWSDIYGVMPEELLYNLGIHLPPLPPKPSKNPKPVKVFPTSEVLHG